jgi:hypothetical protein
MSDEDPLLRFSPTSATSLMSPSNARLHVRASESCIRIYDIWVCIYICMYMHVYIYVYIYIYVYVYIRTYVCMCIAHTCIHTYV